MRQFLPTALAKLTSSLRVFLIIIAASLVFACQTESSSDQIQGQSYGASTGALTDMQPCIDQGGTVTQGLAGPICQMPMPDAGKSCNSSNQCEGQCLANEAKTGGVCAPVKPIVGCFDIYDNGMTVGLCVD